MQEKIDLAIIHMFRINLRDIWLYTIILYKYKVNDKTYKTKQNQITIQINIKTMKLLQDIKNKSKVPTYCD